jgi:hypothetical protein
MMGLGNRSPMKSMLKFENGSTEESSKVRLDKSGLSLPYIVQSHSDTSEMTVSALNHQQNLLKLKAVPLDE